MARSLRPSAIVPADVAVQDVRTEGTATVITARSSSVEAACPECRAPARRLHSRYVRTLADLPLGGRSAQLRLAIRRLRCKSAACARRIFTERLEAAEPWATRTARLDAALVEARDIVDAFHTMVRQKKATALDDWLERAAASLLGSFARGLRKDRAAVHAAISTAWSNAQAEGQITKLKLVKRQMYGRGKLDLLQARVIASGA